MASTGHNMGLNAWARAFVKPKAEFAYSERVVRTYPDGREEHIAERQVFETPIRKVMSNRSCGMFDYEYPLYDYIFDDGRVFEEHLQAAPWSSGPSIFLALKGQDESWISESLWSDKEINSA